MELYVGGYEQGKLEYVRKRHPNVKIMEEAGLVSLWRKMEKGMDDGRLSEELGREAAGGTLVWHRFHLAVKLFLEAGGDGMALESVLTRCMDLCPELVVISDEIGNGIVPMEKKERLYRELTGRLLCRIAERAQLVERIVCGLPLRLKP